MNLIQMSIAAGILIIGIVLFRSLFVHRLSKKVMILLWEIAILRLLIPFSVNLPLPTLFSGIDSLMIVDEQAFGMSTGAFIATIDEEAFSSENTAITYAGTAGPDLRKTAIAVYLIGTAVLLIGSFFLYIRDSRLFREGIPMQEKEKERLLALAEIEEKDLKRFGKVKFQISDRTATPVTYGLFHPAVVFPKGLYLKEEKEVGFCLHHELIHIKNHDNLKKLAAHLALCIHWFNPLVLMMYVLFNRDMELFCDEMVVRKSKESRQDYALALLSLAERRSLGFQTGLGFGKNAVKERIVAVMKFKKMTFAGVLSAVLAVILALTVFITDSVAYAKDTSVAGTAAGEYFLPDAPEWAIFTWKGEAASAAVEEEAPPAIGVWTLSDDVAYEESTNMADVVLNVVMETGTEATWAADEVTAAETLRAAEAVEGTADTEAEASAWMAKAGTSGLAAAAAFDGSSAYETHEVEAVTYESEDLPEEVGEYVRELVDEFGAYGLSGEISQNDYQLYYFEEPVCFFADNQKQGKEKGFSGRLFMRPESEQNGYTGVVTEYNEEGEITGLIHLSVKESENYVREIIGMKVSRLGSGKWRRS